MTSLRYADYIMMFYSGEIGGSFDEAHANST